MSSSDQLDSAIEIVTPENIAFRYELAGPFRRLPAFAIDFALRLGFWIAVMIALSFAGVGQIGFGILLLLWFVLEWFYGGLFETYWNGQTPGKRLIGIRVLTVDGQPINGIQAVMRNILRFADLMPTFPLAALVGEPVPMGIPTGMIGLITPMMNQRYQRLGDIVCGTMVVIEDRSWLFEVTTLDDPRAAQLAEYIPASFQVNRQLSRAIATYVERRRYFIPTRRREIAKHVAKPLLERFHLPSDTSYDLMICALYYRVFVADHQRRDQDEFYETVAEIGPEPRAAVVQPLGSPMTSVVTATEAAAIVKAEPVTPVESFPPTAQLAEDTDQPENS